MVIPSLLIVALDVGIFGGPFVVVPFAAAAVLALLAWREGPGPRRNLLIAADVVLAVLGAELHYGPTSTLVTVSGLLYLPTQSSSFERMANLPFPAPPPLSRANPASPL